MTTIINNGYDGSAIRNGYAYTAQQASGRNARAIADAEAILRRAGVKADIVLRHPEWKPGDVVVIQYAPGQPYTYVRGKDSWPADQGRPAKTDDYINRLYDNGQVNPVLQAGGVPFDRTRIR